MFEHALFFTHGSLLLLFGIFLSAAFTGIRFTRQSVLQLLGLSALCGTLQIIALYFFTESYVWKLYPIITHLPLILFLCILYRKRITTALAAVSTAYLCCQPSKWFGILTISLTKSATAEYIVKDFVLVIVAFITLKYLASYLSEIFNKETRNIYIFGMMPMVYYIFDYSTVIYTQLWATNNRIIAEFLPFFLCIVFVIFSFVYYKEYEQKANAERKKQIIQITVDQQAKEIETVKRNEHEIRILHHDMRLFLNSIAVCIENNENTSALEMISSYSSHIEGAKLERFCKNDTINYVLSDFAQKCKTNHIPFSYTLNFNDITKDEILFVSILSNALDNALNAQHELSEDARYIELLIKSSQGKLLLSVKNPVHSKPIFVNGLPFPNQKGHGYGTQSIRYMTEQLGGNYQFMVQDNTFITRIIINEIPRN